MRQMLAEVLATPTPPGILERLAAAKNDLTVCLEKRRELEEQLHQLLSSYSQFERVHQQLERHHLLVLDELGYVPCTKAGAELLFEVVSRAYERTSLLVTTNLPFEAWTEVLGNERLTGALLDRLTHRIHILEANGESYRLRESQRRLKQRTRTRAARNTS